MKKQNSKIERIARKAVTHMVDTELYEWPPKCAAFLYQPTRPQRTTNGSSVDKRKARS